MPQMNSRKNRTVVGVKFSDFESERSRFSPAFVRHKHTCDLVALSKLHPRLLAFSSVQSKETWKYFAQWRLSSAVRDRGMSLQTHFLWVCKPIFYGSANPYFMVLQTHFLWVCKPTFYGSANPLFMVCSFGDCLFFKFDFDDGNWQQAEARNLLLVWTVEVNVLLPKERYGDPLNGRGSNTEPYN